MRRRKAQKNEKKEHFTYSGPQIEFRNNRQVIVDGCRCILEYEPETVKLNVGSYNIRINGNCLALKNLTNQSVMIEGCISGLEFNC